MRSQVAAGTAKGWVALPGGVDPIISSSRSTTVMMRLCSGSSRTLQVAARLVVLLLVQKRQRQVSVDSRTHDSPLTLQRPLGPHISRRPGVAVEIRSPGPAADVDGMGKHSSLSPLRS